MQRGMQAVCDRRLSAGQQLAELPFSSIGGSGDMDDRHQGGCPQLAR